MKIGLIDIEPKIFNTAYMQIAESYRSNGISVKWASPLEYDQYDRLYCSSLFTFTDKSQIPFRAICGGTGFDVKKRLDVSSAKSQLDYSIYPKCKTSYVWFSRGCIRNCPFCVVRQKEGKIRPVKHKTLNPDGQYITVMDNNFFANPKWQDAIFFLRANDQPVDFQGIDIRTITTEQCKELVGLKFHKQLKVAWDIPTDVHAILKGLERLTKYIKPYKIMCYVLIGFNSTQQEDYDRVALLRDCKIDPFVMPYNKKDLYQRSFARWVNHKAIFKKVKWVDYWKRVRGQENAGTGWGSS